ncbi:MAG: hypothetical protein NW208_06295 [Bryobacter sp.]|nr:hypothetical protein [Bryobacter sp.]
MAVSTSRRAVSRRALLAALASAPAALAANRQETLASFAEHTTKVEARVRNQDHSGKQYLWSTQSSDRLPRLMAGEILTENLGAPAIPGGLAQHWLGAAFFPQATLAYIYTVDADVTNYKHIYSPDIIASQLLHQSPNRLDIYYRLRKKKVLTAVMDTKHRVEFTSLSSTRRSAISHSTEVREVANHGKPSEKVLPIGEGQGLLYVMNSYWRMEQTPEGVFVECEALTLARSLPFGLRAVIGPLINSFAVDSMQHTLVSKRRAVSALSAQIR